MILKFSLVISLVCNKDIEALVPASVFQHCLVFLNRGFTDQYEILHGGSAWPRTGFPILGDSPKDGRVLGVSSGHMAGMIFAEARTCFIFYCILLQMGEPHRRFYNVLVLAKPTQMKIKLLIILCKIENNTGYITLRESCSFELLTFHIDTGITISLRLHCMLPRLCRYSISPCRDIRPCNMHRICISENRHKMLHRRLVHVGETVTDVQILGCELHQNASGGQAAPGPAGGAMALFQIP